MKKLALTLAIVLGLGMASFAQEDYAGERGLFGLTSLFNHDERYGDESLLLPEDHGLEDDVDAAPLGTGIAVLLGLGGAYLVAKKRKED